METILGYENLFILRTTLSEQFICILETTYFVKITIDWKNGMAESTINRWELLTDIPSIKV